MSPSLHVGMIAMLDVGRSLRHNWPKQAGSALHPSKHASCWLVRLMRAPQELKSSSKIPRMQLSVSLAACSTPGSHAFPQAIHFGLKYASVLTEEIDIPPSPGYSAYPGADCLGAGARG